MRLERYIKKAGISGDLFADLAGVKRSTVWSICRGGGTGTVVAERIMRASGGQVKLADLHPKKKRKKRAAVKPAQ